MPCSRPALGTAAETRTAAAKTHDHRQTHDRRPTTAVGSLTQAYAVLGLQREASPDAIKLATAACSNSITLTNWRAATPSLAELARATEKPAN